MHDAEQVPVLVDLGVGVLERPAHPGDDEGAQLDGDDALQLLVPNELRGRVMGIWSMTWFLASVGGFFAGVAKVPLTALNPASTSSGVAATTSAMPPP